MTATTTKNPRGLSEVERARRDRFRGFMDVYYFARHADLLALEAATGLHPAEVEAYVADRPPLVFKAYLIQSRGMPR